jgi:hypothetical protein
MSNAALNARSDAILNARGELGSPESARQDASRGAACAFCPRPAAGLGSRRK